MKKAIFICNFFIEAHNKGYILEICANGEAKGLPQIDFGHKKLHYFHVAKLYDYIQHKPIISLEEFEKIIPGRPCAYAPFRDISKIVLKKVS